MKRSGWRVFGSAFTVVCLAAGSGLTAATLATRTVDEDQVYRGRTDRIVVELGAGRLSVRAGGPAVSVHRHLTWAWTRPAVDERWNDGKLTVRTRCGALQPPSVAVNCATDYALRVPPGVALTVRTTRGDVSVEGVRGPLDLTASAGGVDVTWAGDRISARSATGPVRLRLDRPPVEADIVTGTGDISVVVPRGGRYRVRAATGADEQATVGVIEDPRAVHLLSAQSGAGAVDVRYAR